MRTTLAPRNHRPLSSPARRYPAHVTRSLRALIAVLTATSALALGVTTSASAYPEPVACEVQITPEQPPSGGQFTVHASSTEELDWTITYNNQQQTATGEGVSVTFVAPVVITTTTQLLTVVGQPATAGVGETCHATYNVTVRAPDQAAPAEPVDTLLPNAGGPVLVGALFGILLILVGILLVRHRRHDAT